MDLKQELREQAEALATFGHNREVIEVLQERNRIHEETGRYLLIIQDHNGNPILESPPKTAKSRLLSVRNGELDSGDGSQSVIYICEYVNTGRVLELWTGNSYIHRYTQISLEDGAEILEEIKKYSPYLLRNM